MKLREEHIKKLIEEEIDNVMISEGIVDSIIQQGQKGIQWFKDFQKKGMPAARAQMLLMNLEDEIKKSSKDPNAKEKNIIRAEMLQNIIRKHPKLAKRAEKLLAKIGVRNPKGASGGSVKIPANLQVDVKAAQEALKSAGITVSAQAPGVVTPKYNNHRFKMNVLAYINKLFYKQDGAALEEAKKKKK